MEALKPLERLLGDECGARVPPAHMGRGWGNPTRSLLDITGGCSGEASFDALGHHCKQGELLQFPATEFRAWPVEHILSACLAFLKR